MPAAPDPLPDEPLVPLPDVPEPAVPLPDVPPAAVPPADVPLPRLEELDEPVEVVLPVAPVEVVVVPDWADDDEALPLGAVIGGSERGTVSATLPAPPQAPRPTPAARTSESVASARAPAGARVKPPGAPCAARRLGSR